MSSGKTLFVYMNGCLVGKLIRTTPQHYAFTYEKSWLQKDDSRPISLSMPLTEVPYQDERVYHFFDNLLPDNEQIRDRIQARFQTPTKRTFDLLSQTGKDCVGALQLLTAPLHSASEIKNIKKKPRTNAWIANWLKHYRTAPLGMEKNTNFRISLAGAQEKAALLRYKNQWYEPLGATPTTHIIKLPIGYIEHSGVDLCESVENEWLCLQLLSQFGLSINQAEIIHFEDIKTLVVERFDRRWSHDRRWIMRLPQEDLCQALGRPAALKYESDGGPGIVDIMTKLRGAYHAQEDRQRFMKSIFLFWVMAAMDGHAKNFSVHIGVNGRYQLTPLYDVISYFPMIEEREVKKQKLSMAMALRSKNKHCRWDKFQLRHWYATAAFCQFPKHSMQSIMDEVLDTLDSVIDKVSMQLPKGFPPHIAEPIFNGMKTVKNKC